MISSLSDSDYVSVYVDDVLHIHFWKKHYRGLQSFHDLTYSIEILLKDHTLKVEYDSREMWVKVLNTLDQII